MTNTTPPDPPRGLGGRGWEFLMIVGVVFAAHNGLHLTTFMLLGDTVFTDYVGLWSFGRFV
ncbi:MAG: hypothetical protein EXR09_02255 [Acetobacteraceae bacterium]|nr:hypothetical protein [Acetobacteraceae bacterium]